MNPALILMLGGLGQYSCQTARATSYSYGTTYAAPVASTYNYGYQATSYAYAQPKVVKEIQFIAVAPSYDYYLGLAGSYLKDERAAVKQAEEQKSLATQVERLAAVIERMQQQQQPPQVIVQAPQPQPQPQPAPMFSPVPSPQGPSPQTPDGVAPPPVVPGPPPAPDKNPPVPGKSPRNFTPVLPPAPWGNPPTVPPGGPANTPPGHGVVPTDAALGVLNNRCARCHTGDPSKGNFRIFDAPGQPAALTLAQLRKIRARALGAEDMPPTAPLPDEDQATLFNWLIGPVRTAAR